MIKIRFAHWALVFGFLTLNATLAFAENAPVPTATPEAIAPQAEETVKFNMKSKKFHKPSCQFARICTNNCVTVKRTEAESKGAVPCKVCGG